MTGITPAIAAARAARKEFNEETRNLSPDFIKKVQDGQVTSDELQSSKVQKVVELWKRCSFEVEDNPSPL